MASGGDKTDKPDSINSKSKVECTLAFVSSDPQICMQIIKLKLRNGKS